MIRRSGLFVTGTSRDEHLKHTNMISLLISELQSFETISESFLKMF